MALTLAKDTSHLVAKSNGDAERIHEGGGVGALAAAFQCEGALPAAADRAIVW